MVIVGNYFEKVCANNANASKNASVIFDYFFASANKIIGARVCELQVMNSWLFSALFNETGARCAGAVSLVLLCAIVNCKMNRSRKCNSRSDQRRRVNDYALFPLDSSSENGAAMQAKDLMTELEKCPHNLLANVVVRGVSHCHGFFMLKGDIRTLRHLVNAVDWQGDDVYFEEAQHDKDILRASRNENYSVPLGSTLAVSCQY